jgi:hypothetical protein
MKPSFSTKLTLAIGAALMLALPQLAMAGHTNTVLTADLDGRQEVANDARDKRIVGDPNGRGEAYVFGIDGDPATLCYVLLVEKIQLVPVTEGMMAHIHFGQRGENGPVVAALAGPFDGNAADCLTEGEPGKFPLDPMAGSGIVQDILNHPGDYYINVHNPELPAGAVRGQLEYVEEEEHDDHD